MDAAVKRSSVDDKVEGAATIPACRNFTRMWFTNLGGGDA
jgi:hypothetical protein